MSQGNNIKVVARFRPQNSIEIREGGEPIIEVVEDHTVAIKSEDGPSSFTFDRVFGMDTSQLDLYEYSIVQTLEDVFNGYNGTVFAYGQTGSGKTYTMMGSDIEDENGKGVIPRIVEGIFGTIMESPATVEYIVKVSYMEIYMEKIRDLLNPSSDNLQVHEEKSVGVYVKGLMEVFVGSVEEVYDTMKQGAKSRVVAYTNMNAESSRSHSIFQITIHQKNTVDGKTKIGRLSLVDLAGSEKVGKTGASGQTLEEAKKINKSLSALGMVINALTDGKSSHIPYRDSKLTRILQESLGGNSRTTLIINCSPSSYNAAETVSTLRFGTRAKSITNKAMVNALLGPEELKAMIKKLNARIVNYCTYITSLEIEIKTWRSGVVVAQDEQVVLQDITDHRHQQQQQQQQQQRKQPQKHDSIQTQTQTQTQRDRPSSKSQRMTTKRISQTVQSRSSSPQTFSESRSSLVSPDPTASISSLDGSMADLTLGSVTPDSLSDDEKEGFLKRENEMSDMLDEKEQQLKQQMTENEQLGNQVDVLSKELDKAILKNEALVSELSQLQLDKERSDFSLKEAQLTIDSLSSTCESLKTQYDELKQEQAQAQTQTQTQTQQSTDSGMLSQLQTQNLELARKYSDLEQQHNKLMAEYEEFLEKSIAADEAQSSLESKQVSEVSKRLELQYSARIDHQTKRISELLSQQKQTSESVSSLNATLQENSVTISSLEAKNKSLKAELEAARLAAQTAQAAYASIQASHNASTISTPTSTSTPTSATATVPATVPAAASPNDSTANPTNLAVTNKRMTQRLAEFESMRRSLMRDVQNRCEKIIELEMTLDEMREQNASLQKSLDDKSSTSALQPTAILEKNLTQLTQMQKDLVVQNSNLKQLNALNERKLEGRAQRIESLEQRLETITNNYEATKRVVEDLRAQLMIRGLNNASNASSGVNGINGIGSDGNPASSLYKYAKIVKPIRGGGGGGSNTDGNLSLTSLVTNPTTTTPAPTKKLWLRW